jgi:hypothetical protein
MTTRIGVLVIVAAHCASAKAGDEKPSEAPRLKNLVANASLEEKVDQAGLPPGWGQFYAMPAGAYSYSIVDAGRTGKKAMRIAGDGTFGAMPANRIEIDPTKRYVVRGWIKIQGDADATADVKLHYYAADGRYLDQTRIGYVSPTTDEWQFVTVTDRVSSFPQAKLIGLAIAATGKVEAWYDDLELIAFDKGALPKDFENQYGITRSPQLALLGRRIGDWATETTVKPCVWVPRGSKSKGVESIRWALGGQFIEGRAMNETMGVESLYLMTFDRKRKAYRHWHFDSQGNFPNGDSFGTWNETAQTLHFEATEDNHVHIVIDLTLTGNDFVKLSGTWKDKDGRILLDMEGTSTRKEK